MRVTIWIIFYVLKINDLTKTPTYPFLTFLTMKLVYTNYLLSKLYTITPWPSRIKVFGDQWVNQWCGVSQGVTKVN